MEAVSLTALRFGEPVSSPVYRSSSAQDQNPGEEAETGPACSSGRGSAAASLATGEPSVARRASLIGHGAATGEEPVPDPAHGAPGRWCSATGIGMTAVASAPSRS